MPDKDRAKQQPSMTNHRQTEKILILDFGSQYTQLIARRVREAGVYSEVHPHDMPAKDIQTFKPKAIILSGGPASATLGSPIKVAQVIFQMDIPILGICYGMQVMALQLGGQVAPATIREFGYAQVRARSHTLLLKDIQDKTNDHGHGLLDVWMSHGDQVIALPAGFTVMGSTENAPIAAMADEQRRFYALQFHPEVTHTKQGPAIIERFLHQIAACHRFWNIDNIIDNAEQQIATIIGKEQVILALSGGVDSAVVAALLQRVIGDQLQCIFVDNGLLRLHEGDNVMVTFAKNMGIKVKRINAEQQFLQALQGISDPEQKRKIIGKQFIDIFTQQAQALQGIKWLAQGTIYPDVIESAGTTSNKAKNIKTHHNVGGLPPDMQLQLIEPLRELFKDEVRQVGLKLNVPKEIIQRHPFPGPGLGVRILGEVRKEYADLLRQVDAIYIEALHEWQLYHKISQAFAVFLPIKSVSVMGDNRQYDYVVALRAVETVDFMTARWVRLPYDFLEAVANRIINEVAGISRVTYDISSKPPATIEWE